MIGQIKHLYIFIYRYFLPDNQTMQVHMQRSNHSGIYIDIFINYAFSWLAAIFSKKAVIFIDRVSCVQVRGQMNFNTF
jgi:hypothetical protein